MTLDYEKLLQTYFGYVGSKNLEAVVAMYAADGALILQNGQRISGRVALLEFFEVLFRQSPPAPQIINIIGSDRHCAVELRVALPGSGEMAVADFFQFDDVGLILSVTIYAREIAR